MMVVGNEFGQIVLIMKLPLIRQLLVFMYAIFREMRED